ncbi:MAG: hypothetical protein JW941_11190 [Candidatus Coatesbacteria bacterium]|nr:hypothetical protein [Candidatus Coatesbacteria bacterium]
MVRKYLLILYAVLLLVPAVSLGDMTGDHPPEDLVFQDTGPYGVEYSTIPNLDNTGNIIGLFNINGIPAGSPIVKAFLYLNGVEIDNQYQGAGGSFNFNNLPWRNPADYVDTLTFSDTLRFYATGYKWDVTSYVTGDGSYEIVMNGPMWCLSAFLVVVYENEDLSPVMVSITMGEEILGPSATGAAGGESLVHIPNVGAGNGHLILFGEGLSAPSGDETILFNGNGGNVDVFYTLGQAFDAGGVATQDGVNIVGLRALYDLLLWKIVVLISPEGEEPDPIDKIEAKLDRDLPRIEEKLDIDLPRLEEKLDKIDPGIVAIERKLDGLEDLNIDVLIEGITKLEEKADKIGPITDQIEAIEEKIDKHFGDVSFYEMEEKIDNIGEDLSDGLHHLYQIPTAASIDAIEEKLDKIGPDVSMILWDQFEGLPAVLEAIAHGNGMLDYLYTTHATIVVTALQNAEEKLDGLGYSVDMILNDTSYGLVTINAEIARLETKLDNQHEWFYGFDMDLEMLATLCTITNGNIYSVERKLDEMQPDVSAILSGQQELFPAILQSTAYLEAKLDEGVLPGIEKIIGMIHEGTEATLAMIEAKLDEMGPMIEELGGYMTYIPDMFGLVQSNYQLLYGIEAKLDGETGLGYSIDMLEAKIDRFEPKIDTIHSYQPDIIGLIQVNYQALGAIEAKLDGQESAVGYIEAKLDDMDPKLAEIYSYQPDIYGGVMGNSEALGAIEAKLDNLSQYELWLIPGIYEVVVGTEDAIYGIETKLDEHVMPGLELIDAKLDGAELWRLPTTSTLVAMIYHEILPSIESKLDESIPGAIDTVKDKIDEEVIPPLGEIEFKIDQTELKLLSLLLRQDQECLPPMAFTPTSINPHGKLEEVMEFVRITLENLIEMGYLIYDSRSWSEYQMGLTAYNEGQWYYAGHHFWDAYKYASCDASPPQQ